MAYKAKNVPATRKNEGANKKGNPKNSIASKASVKDPHIENLEEDQKYAEEYMDEVDDPANNVQVRHPNRNVDKPDIDKPSY